MKRLFERLRNLGSDKLVGLGVIGLVVGILFVGLREFFVTRDGIFGITGWEALQQAGVDFWIGAVLFSLGAGVLLYVVMRKLKFNAGYGVSLNYLLPIIIFIAIAWGKGCTDKANDGVTSGKGRPRPVPVDTLRIPAEDLLQKHKAVEYNK